QGLLRLRGEFIVDGQDAEMIAGDPQQELAVAENLANDLAGARAPVLVSRQRVEGERAQAYLVRVTAGAGRHLFAAIVGEYFSEGVGEQLGAAATTGATEEVEREEASRSFHGSAI